MKRLLLLDHDGVLVDTEPWYLRAAEEVLADVGLVLDRERYLADTAAGRGTWAQVRDAGVDEDAIGRLRQQRDIRYQHHLRTQPIEVDGVVEVLRSLAPLVRMAVVTTAKRADVDLIHADREILPLMELVLVREDYGRAKPHPEPYLTALQRLGGVADDALVVEDSERGLRSAVAAGIDCAVVDHPLTRGGDLSAATHRISSLAEVEAILRAD